MDIGSIIGSVLSTLLSTLALWLLGEAGKRIRSAMKQRAKKPKEVLDQSLLATEEYKHILRNRHFYRMLGYTFLIAFLAFFTIVIIAWVRTRQIDLSIGLIGMPLLFLCETPLVLYIGYSPISPREVEQRRQRNRAKMFKEANGATPYGYIMFFIISPLIFCIFTVLCIVGFVQFFALSSSGTHIPLLGRILGTGVPSLVCLFCACAMVKIAYSAIKNWEYVPIQQQYQLREQFAQGELKQ